MPTSAADLGPKVEALTERIGDLIDTIHQNGVGSQRVNQTVSAGGFAMGVALASCVCSVFLALAILIIDNRSFGKMENTQRDQGAWLDVLRAKVATLEAKTK